MSKVQQPTPPEDPQEDNKEKDWLTNPNEVERVKTLLSQTGYPLEVQVAHICAQFIRGHHHLPGDSFWQNTPFVYRSQNTLREVDRLLTITSHADGYEYGMRISFTVPIECKHRENITVFGFPTPDNKTISPLIFSDYASSELFRALNNTLTPFDTTPPCLITTLEKDTKGWKSYKEDLFHNASASLYDALLYMFPPDKEYQPEWIPDSDLLDKTAQNIVHYPNFELPVSVRSQLRDFPPEKLAEFNQLIDEETHEVDIEIVLPIICVDMPLYRSTLAPDGKILQLEPAQWLSTYQRVGQGLSAYRYQLLNPQMELPVFIVQVDYLSQFLNDLIEWGNKALDTLARVDDVYWNKASLQAAVFWKAFHNLASK